MTAAPILEVRGLGKSFGGLRVIDDLSFQIGRGERLALIGPNGAGKSTAFNLITGVHPVDAGQVWLGGEEITTVPARLRIRKGLARTFQNIRLLPHLTVLENVMIAQYAHAPGFFGMLQPIGLGRGNHWRMEARAALAETGLEGYAEQPAGALPYGIQKRIELVRALLAQPRVLLLDEPAAGLNPVETEALQIALRAVSARGVTLVVVEHDMQFICDLCERVVVLDFGCKIADCATDGLHADPQVREAYLGSDAQEAVLDAA